MSRIEKALERALELRDAQHGAAREGTAVAEVATSIPKFVTPAAVVDKGLVERHLVCITEPYARAAEQYKKLRARVLKATKKDSLSALMVTSAGIGEGKTITAINLAAAMANAYDHTVLLVDADLRKPSVCGYLGLKPKVGLSDCLAGKAEVRDAIINTGIGKLAVLPAGNPSEDSAEMLASDRMKALVQEMKSRYKDRYVIFDAPPVLATADPLSLASFMDGSIIVVQADKTSEKALAKAVSLLSGYRIFGVVLNNMPERMAEALYPYYDHYKAQEIREGVGSLQG